MHTTVNWYFQEWTDGMLMLACRFSVSFSVLCRQQWN